MVGLLRLCLLELRKHVSCIFSIVFSLYLALFVGHVWDAYQTINFAYG